MAIATTRGWSGRPAARTSSSRTPSADVDALRVGLVRGAFEYQGQKCSAASRAFIAASLWQRLRDDLADAVRAIPMGDPTDFSNFMGAVIDRRAFDRLDRRARAEREPTPRSPCSPVVASDDSVGFFVEPTVLVGTDPTHEVFTTELFGPVLAVHVYDDAKYAGHVRHSRPGHAVRADRVGVRAGSGGRRGCPATLLRYAAGNFYVNDKPTGAVVGQQPFGGARSSGTNDKAGSAYNLLRWTSPRVVKETHRRPRVALPPHGLIPLERVSR